ncbi:hypothetical protein D3C83_180730 [compost metagenome]
MITLTRARSGLGSFTKRRMRDTVGRTLSTTTSASLICGVTFMTKPTGTTFWVVVKATIGAELLVPGVTCAWTVK